MDLSTSWSFRPESGFINFSFPPGHALSYAIAFFFFFLACRVERLCSHLRQRWSASWRPLRLLDSVVEWTTTGAARAAEENADHLTHGLLAVDDRLRWAFPPLLPFKSWSIWVFVLEPAELTVSVPFFSRCQSLSILGASLGWAGNQCSIHTNTYPQDFSCASTPLSQAGFPWLRIIRPSFSSLKFLVCKNVILLVEVFVLCSRCFHSLVTGLTFVDIKPLKSHKSCVLNNEFHCVEPCSLQTD